LHEKNGRGQQKGNPLSGWRIRHAVRTAIPAIAKGVEKQRGFADNQHDICVFAWRVAGLYSISGDREMTKARWLLKVLCTIVLSSGMAGCHRSGNASTSAGAEDEFVQAFLTAHDSRDLDAEEKLVDWDNVTENSRNHFIGELKSGLDVKITAKVEDLPAVPAGFSARYNIPPEKFLTVVYAYVDSRGAITVKFPIAKKDGRYYFALRKE